MLSSVLFQFYMVWWTVECRLEIVQHLIIKVFSSVFEIGSIFIELYSPMCFKVPGSLDQVQCPISPNESDYCKTRFSCISKPVLYKDETVVHHDQNLISCFPLATVVIGPLAPLYIKSNRLWLHLENRQFNIIRRIFPVGIPRQVLRSWRTHKN